MLCPCRCYAPRQNGGEVEGIFYLADRQKRGGTWSGISDATSQTKCSLCVIYKKLHAPLQWKTLIISINLSLIGPTANTPRHHLISVHVQSVDPLWENAYRQSTRGDDEGDSFSTVGFVLTAMHFSEN